MKTLNEYLALPYQVNIFPGEPDEGGWVAEVPELPGCMTQADTWDELKEMIDDAKFAWISTALEDDMPVPEPKTLDERTYSGRFLLRLPKNLHRELVTRADQEGVSLNQLATGLLAGGVGWEATSRPASSQVAEDPSPYR